MRHHMQRSSRVESQRAAGARLVAPSRCARRPCRKIQQVECVYAGQSQRPLTLDSLTPHASASAVWTAQPQARVSSLSSVDLDVDAPVAFEILQGPLVRWTNYPDQRSPPTALILHGLLGSRRNMQSLAHNLLERHPNWQVILADLRCHGETASLGTRGGGPHTVGTAAEDVIKTLRELKLFPTVLIGHSFGGKVVMSMVQQFGKRLPREVQVWVLDSLPGQVFPATSEWRDHPGKLIDYLRRLPGPIENRNEVASYVQSAGFSPAVASWVTTNLTRAKHAASQGLQWIFDLDGAAQLFKSYESHSLWPLLEAPPQGAKISFVKAERSTFRWSGEDEGRITALGHEVHLLPNAGHWVHVDNPRGLLEMVAPSFVVRR